MRIDPTILADDRIAFIAGPLVSESCASKRETADANQRSQTLVRGSSKFIGGRIRTATNPRSPGRLRRLHSLQPYCP